LLANAGEFGYHKDGSKGPGYEPGMELHGKYVMLGEGARGSLSKVAIAKYNLKDGREPSKFGLGMKEIWEIAPEKHNEGAVLHSAGWPLGAKQGGGSFVYHAENNQVFLGMIVDLNYKNPNRYPYMDFQKWKTHPDIKDLLEGGKRVAYGARVVTKGGIQAVPKVAFPGLVFMPPMQRRKPLMRGVLVIRYRPMMICCMMDRLGRIYARFGILRR